MKSDWLSTRDADDYFEDQAEAIDAARLPTPEPEPETPEADRSTDNDDIPF